MIKKLLLLTIFAQLSLTANTTVNNLSKINTEIIKNISSKITLKNNPPINFNNNNESIEIVTFLATPISTDPNTSYNNFKWTLSINEYLFDTYTKSEREFIIARNLYAIDGAVKLQSIPLKTDAPTSVINIALAYLLYKDDSNALKINKYMPWYQKNLKWYYRTGIWLIIGNINAMCSKLIAGHLKNNIIFDLDIQSAKAINSFDAAISFLEKHKLVLEKQIENGDSNLSANLNLVDKRISALQQASLN